jgi:hypothetical protein
MAYEQKDGQGSLFKNTDKETEQQADYKGSIKIDGREYWLNSWLRESKGGKKYMSLSAQPKVERPAVTKIAPVSKIIDDDIGF